MIKTHQAPPLVAMRFFKALLFSLVILTLSSAWATSLYVDDDSTALNPDGSEEYPFPTVNDAVARALGDDSVDDIVILPGVYIENIQLIGFPRDLTFRSTYDPELNSEELIDNTIIA